MSVLLPLVGGIVLGRYAPWIWALVGQALLSVVAIVALVATAPGHGGDQSPMEVFVFTVIVACLAAITLMIGRAWRRRTVSAV
jgi:hypothetical protein